MNPHAAGAAGLTAPAAGLSGPNPNQARSAPTNPQMNKARQAGASSSASSSAASANGPFRKGHWSVEEDIRLIQYVRKYGEGRWSKLAKAAGLQRCGKSCRLRWVNYLRPDIKRGHISEEEERLIIKLHSLLGNRWSLIAIHLPGRSDNEIKNYWRSHIKKKLKTMDQQLSTNTHNMDTSSSGVSQLDQEIGHYHNSFNASTSLVDATSCNFDMSSLEVSPTSSTHEGAPIASHITSCNDHDNYHRQDDMLLFNTINNLNHHFIINNNSNLPSCFNNYNMLTTSDSNTMSFNAHYTGVGSNLSNNFGMQLSCEMPSQLQVGEDIYKLLATSNRMQGHEPSIHMQYDEPSNLPCNIIRGEKVDSHHCSRVGEVWDQINFGARQSSTQQPIVPFSYNANQEQGVSIPDSESIPWDVETIQPIVELENMPCQQVSMDSNFNFELWEGEIFQMDVDQKLLREHKYHT